MENAVMDAILRRRSVRAFTGEPVEPEILEQIALAGIYAANACGEQNGRVIVIGQKDVLAELIALVRKAFTEMEMIPEQYRHRTISKARRDPEHFDFMYHAPILMLAVAPTEWIHSMADCASMLQNMQIAGTAFGVSSCYVNQIRWLDEDRHPELRRMLAALGVKETESVYGSLAVGYPEVYPGAARRREGRITFFV